MSERTNWVQVRSAVIRERIRERELKQWWVAAESGVHKTTLRRWLSGHIEFARAERVFRLAQVLEIPFESLVA